MSDSPVLLPFFAPLRAVQNVLAHFHNRGIVIGGIAVSLLGKERTTADIDAIVLLTLDDIPDLLAVAALEGLTPRIADVVTFARRSRVVLPGATARPATIRLTQRHKVAKVDRRRTASLRLGVLV